MILALAMSHIVERPAIGMEGGAFSPMERHASRRPPLVLNLLRIRKNKFHGETHFCRNWFHHETHLGGVLLSDYPCMACVTEDIQIGETPVQIVFPAESAPSAIEDIRAVLFAESCIYSVQKNCKKT